MEHKENIVFEALAYPELQRRTRLRRGHHLDRTRQFAERHCWPMRVDADGLESDDFDGDGTTYCLVHTADTHFASLRLRRAADGTMLERAFAPVWTRHAESLKDAVEVTRLCSGRYLDETERQWATVELLLGLCRHGRATGQKHLFGVVYPGVARAIRRAGWESQVADQFERDGRTIVLATWECSALVDWRLQDRLDTLSTLRPAPPAALTPAA